MNSELDPTKQRRAAGQDSKGDDFRELGLSFGWGLVDRKQAVANESKQAQVDRDRKPLGAGAAAAAAASAAKSSADDEEESGEGDAEDDHEDEDESESTSGLSGRPLVYGSLGSGHGGLARRKAGKKPASKRRGMKGSLKGKKGKFLARGRPVSVRASVFDASDDEDENGEDREHEDEDEDESDALISERKAGSGSAAGAGAGAAAAGAVRAAAASGAPAVPSDVDPDSLITFDPEAGRYFMRLGGELLTKLKSVLHLEGSLSAAELDTLQRLADTNDTVTLTAFNLYLQDRNWKQFKVRLWLLLLTTQHAGCCAGDGQAPSAAGDDASRGCSPCRWCSPRGWRWRWCLCVRWLWRWQVRRR